VGRESELAQARELLDRTRLLTLTGPGGCGKTRLAIELACRVLGDFPDGVHFVSLAAVRDPALVPASIARSIGLQDARSTPLVDHLAGYLAQRGVLLVLDNVEQVLAAAGFVADLLAATVRTRILVTSRAPLRLSWEQEFPVPPLRIPEVAAAPAECESVQLFVARAAATVPGFALTAENVAAVADIVRRLDGLPLAIELAAARVKVLPPDAIAARLAHSLSLLVSGRRDVPDRQRTLRGAISWSFDLLSEPARRLLAVCSVFRGGIDLGRLEHVAAATRVPALDALTELVDHSLLRPIRAAAPRFAMLETVREFAVEQLRERPEQGQVRAAHAEAFWELAKDLDRPPSCPDLAGLNLLEQEHDNFRAALDWYGEADPIMAVRLANRLTGFWSIRGHFSEGRRRLGDLLERVPADHPERLDALAGAAWLAVDQGDRETAIGMLEESVERARAAGDTGREAAGLTGRGRAKLIIGDPGDGRADIERALVLQAEVGEGAGLAAALWLGGAAAHFENDLALSVQRFERCAELSAALGLPAIGARATQLLGLARLGLGDLRGARAALAEGVPVVVDLGDRFAIPIGLSALAGLAAETDRPRAALRLAGAAAAYEETNQTHRPQLIRSQTAAWLAPIRAKMGAAARRLFDDGRRLTPDEAIALGLDERPDLPADPSAGLTRREQEIAALVATGLTNRDIAGKLYLSVRTVETHVDHALSKLGFRTRTQLAAWILAQRDT
jgi:predicted ATPase/DNA-binding CsgD family transcriptional regulator